MLSKSVDDLGASLLTIEVISLEFVGAKSSHSAIVCLIVTNTLPIVCLIF